MKSHFHARRYTLIELLLVLGIVATILGFSLQTFYLSWDIARNSLASARERQAVAALRHEWLEFIHRTPPNASPVVGDDLPGMRILDAKAGQPARLTLRQGDWQRQLAIPDGWDLAVELESAAAGPPAYVLVLHAPDRRGQRPEKLRIVALTMPSAGTVKP